MKKIFFQVFSLVILLCSILSACARSASALSGSWRLVSYGPASNPTLAVPEVETSLVFDQENLVGGTMGCNSFSGSYELQGDKITFSALTSTLMACEEARMQQETTVFGLLAFPLYYEMDGDKLMLSSEDGSSVLIFSK